MDEIEPKKKYITWQVLALMDFVTVIGFDDIIYNFQNQGMAVVFSWIVLLFAYVLPYELMVGHLGSAFSKDGGGLSSWMRHTSGDVWGYLTAWCYWVASLPYLVDVANSMVVSFFWIITGNGNLEDKLSRASFALLTAAITILFIFFQHKFTSSLQVLSIIGGGAMFVMTILFVLMTFVGLLNGGHIATHPLNAHTFIPKFDLHYFSTIGLLIFAMNGAELVAPYVGQMKDGKKDFPKAMMALALMTAFLTIFGSLAIGVFFDANHLPADLKMNGSYYAFLALGQQFHMGKVLLYIFAVTQAIYMGAQLAMLLDGGTRIFLSDTAKQFLPKALTKTNKQGLPINGYWLTTGICTFVLASSAFLPEINDIFNWLLNINGIVSPFVTCFIFVAFLRVRFNSEKFPSEYTYIKNKPWAIIVGFWCLAITALGTIFSIFPQDATPGTAKYTHELILNIVVSVALMGLGVILPLVAKFQRKRAA
ncbi:APC family permease [Latilactobacillus curvatus]|uniref:APC family permease n=1 Tax=Latilactobacillus curvatus TaxID=28038 RepID=UPI00240FAE87|nr:amino acid permease [Latilactobacillus curvatus]MDG2981871.1 amino acid permease [Latilactobacillus curvatus]